jgi:hypothetical protein
MKITPLDKYFLNQVWLFARFVLAFLLLIIILAIVLLTFGFIQSKF